MPPMPRLQFNAAHLLKKKGEEAAARQKAEAGKGPG